MTTALAFQSTTFDVIDRSGQPWIRSPQLGGALGYAKTDAVLKIYDRHAEEFTDSMTAVITLPTPGGPQETRIFSLRGCHLLAMFARTPVAKAFRVWVLDVLEALNRPQSQLLDTTSRLSTRTDPVRKELTAMINAWVGVAPKVAAEIFKEYDLDRLIAVTTDMENAVLGGETLAHSQENVRKVYMKIPYSASGTQSIASTTSSMRLLVHSRFAASFGAAGSSTCVLPLPSRRMAELGKASGVAPAMRLSRISSMSRLISALLLSLVAAATALARAAIALAADAVLLLAASASLTAAVAALLAVSAALATAVSAAAGAARMASILSTALDTSAMSLATADTSAMLPATVATSAIVAADLYVDAAGLCDIDSHIVTRYYSDMELIIFFAICALLGGKKCLFTSRR